MNTITARDARIAYLTTRRDQILLGFRRMDVHYVAIRDELAALAASPEIHTPVHPVTDDLAVEVYDVEAEGL